MRHLRERVAQILAQHLPIEGAILASWLESPPDPSMGDLALPCFRLSKELKKSPQAIAQELAMTLSATLSSATAAATALAAGVATTADSASSDGPGFWRPIASVTAAGPYLNIRLTRAPLFSSLLRAADADDGYFTGSAGVGQTVAIDLSSPNIAKPFSMGHLRSTVIGTAVANLLEADGYRVLRINHLGDWGTQFGKIIVAYKRWGDEARIREHPIAELQELYVRFHEEVKDRPELEDEARAAFKRLEDGDPEDLKLWRWMVDVSLTEFEHTYAFLGTHFTHALGESFYNDKMPAVIDELVAKNLLVESEGAEVVMLDQYDLPPCLIRKSDGATLYATRDLAAALYRHHQLGADELLYVVGGEQRLHFQQVFKVLERMGYAFAKNSAHVAFGLMKLNGKKMSTRKGQIVRLQDVLDEAVARVRAIIDEKNPGLDNADAVATAIGAGAVIFNDLKTHRLHEIDFNMETALAFDGETGPYAQYTHARACSVLRKAGLLAQGESPGKLTTTEIAKTCVFEDASFDEPTWQLTKLLAAYPDIRGRARAEYDPSLVAKHVLDICQAFNRFYHDCPILGAEPGLRELRLCVTDLARAVIRSSLSLLGLKQPAEI